MAQTITVDSDGQVRAIWSDDLAWLRVEGDCRKRRASHVVPSVFLLRLAFRVLRGLLGDQGRCAAWTRRWRCSWLVDLRPSGGGWMPGTFADRDEAIEAELAWLHNERGL
jgi:hypothetical protein